MAPPTAATTTGGSRARGRGRRRSRSAPPPPPGAASRGGRSQRPSSSSRTRSRSQTAASSRTTSSSRSATTTASASASAPPPSEHRPAARRRRGKEPEPERAPAAKKPRKTAKKKAPNKKKNGKKKTDPDDADFVEFPAAIDPTLGSTRRKKKKSTSSSSPVAAAGNAGGLAAVADLLEDVSVSLTNARSSIWLSTFGADAAAKHCLPELRRLGVIHRKVVCPAGTGDPYEALLQQQQQQQEEEEEEDDSAKFDRAMDQILGMKKKNEDDDIPTLLARGNPVPPKGKRLAIESYLRNGEDLPASDIGPDHPRAQQLLREVAGTPHLKAVPFKSRQAWFNARGELRSHNRDLSVGRLLDLFERGILQDNDDGDVIPPFRVYQREVNVETRSVLGSLRSLASPEGVYAQPVVVSLPVLTPLEPDDIDDDDDDKTRTYELQIGVYCHRLLFECDYADDLLVVMSALDSDSYDVVEPLHFPPPPPNGPVFESDPSHTVVFPGDSDDEQQEDTSVIDMIEDGMEDDDDDDGDDDLSCCTRDETEKSAFSTQGLLQLMESKGNDISDWPNVERTLENYLQVELMLHQVHGVCWMMQMESLLTKSKYGLNSVLWEVRRFPDGHGIYFYSPVLGQVRLHLEKSPYHPPTGIAGGLLCDQVGLGKTVEVLALVCATLDELKDGDDDSEEEGVDDDDDDVDRYSHATLVVVTPALVTQWFAEIQKITGASLVCEYFDHDTGEFERPSKLSSLSSSSPPDNQRRSSSKVDIVVTTYNSFETKTTKKRKRGKLPATILKSVPWARVVLDEMQEIRSDKTSIAKNIEELDCSRRWMVSGSPLFDGLDDLRGELAFLRLVPFGANVEDGFWDYAIKRPFQDEHPHAIELLRSLGQVLLRRQKSTRVIGTGATILDLEKYSLEMVSVPQDPSERAAYCCLEYLNHALSELPGFETEHSVLIRLLRSACFSPALLYPNLKDINALWTHIHRRTHAALPQSAVLSCSEAIQFLSQVVDDARVDSDFVTHQTLGGSRGASGRNRALESVETRREDASKKLAVAVAKIAPLKTKRAKALWHYLLEKVTTGRISLDTLRQAGVSSKFKSLWMWRFLLLGLPRDESSRLPEMLKRGWRPGSSFYLTEGENPDRAEKIRGLQRQFPNWAWASSFCFLLSAIPQEVDETELYDAIVSTATAKVKIVPLYVSGALFWSAFVQFHTEDDYRSFEALSKRVDGVLSKSSKRIPVIEEHIKEAQEKLTAAKAQFKVYETNENKKLQRDAQRALAKAKLGLRILFKGNNYLDGHIMCSHALSALRDTSPSSYLAPRLQDIISHVGGTLAVQKNVRDVQVSALKRLNNIDPNVPESTGEMTTFEVLQNVRNGSEEDTCEICYESLANGQIALTRCGHLFCYSCYFRIHNQDFVHCCFCRKPVLLSETKIVDPKRCEDPAAIQTRHRQATLRLRQVAEELEKSNGKLSAEMWRVLYDAFPVPANSVTHMNVRFPALPGHFLAHLKNATGLPICNSTTALLQISSQYSPKIRALLKDLPTDERSVVFASSKPAIMLLLKVFDREGIDHRALYTGQSEKLSGRAVNEWQTIDSCKVLLVQAGAAACGLTLTAARKMFIMDPFLKHEEEKQAYARIHRIGQTKKVEIKVYFTPVSVESRLLEWRERSGSQDQDAATIVNVLHGSKPEEEDDDKNDEDQLDFLLGRDGDGATDDAGTDEEFFSADESATEP